MVPQNTCPKCKKLLPGAVFHIVIPPGQEHLYFCQCHNWLNMAQRWYDRKLRPSKVWC